MPYKVEFFIMDFKFRKLSPIIFISTFLISLPVYGGTDYTSPPLTPAAPLPLTLKNTGSPDTYTGNAGSDEKTTDTKGVIIMEADTKVTLNPGTGVGALGAILRGLDPAGNAAITITGGNTTVEIKGGDFPARAVSDAGDAITTGAFAGDGKAITVTISGGEAVTAAPPTSGRFGITFEGLTKAGSTPIITVGPDSKVSRIRLPTAVNSSVTVNGTPKVFEGVGRTGFGAGVATVHFNGSFTQTDGSPSLCQNIDVINVNNAGTELVIESFGPFETFNINTGARVLLRNGNFVSGKTTGGTINNSGILEIGGGAPNFTTIATTNGTLKITKFGTGSSGSTTGNLTATGASTLEVDTDYTTSGTISGYKTIKATNGTFTINQPITGSTNFINNSTVTLKTGGNYQGPMTGAGGSTSVLNIDGLAFTTPAAIADVKQINVLNGGGSLTVNQPISGFEDLTINSGNQVTVMGGGSLAGTTITNKSGTLTVAVGAGPVTANLVGDGPGLGSKLELNDNFTTAGTISDYNSIVLAATKTLTVGHAISGIETFTNTNATTVINGGSLSAKTITGGVITLNSGTLSGAIQNPTNLSINGGAATGTVTGATAMTVAGGSFKGTVNTPNTFTLSSGSVLSDINGATTININGGSMTGTITGTPDVNIGGDFATGGTIAAKNLTVNTGTFTIGHAVTPTTTFVNSGNIVVNSGGSVSSGISGGGTTTVNGGLLSGPITQNTVTLNSGAINNTITDATTVTVTGGTLTGNIAASSAATTTLNLSGGAITGNVLAKAINISGGSIAGNITGTPDINITGNFVAGGTISANTLTVSNTGVFTLTAPLTATIFNLNGGKVIGNIENAGTLNITGGSIAGNVTGTPNININGNFGTTGTMAANAFAVNGPSVFTVNDTITATTFTNTGTTVVNSGGLINTAIDSTGGNIIVNGGSLGGVITKATNLTLNSGTINNNIVDATTITMTGGTLTGNIATGGISPTTLNLSGGAIAGNVLAKAINISGGSITGTTVATNININGNFTTGGTMAVNQLTVNGPVTFTANHVLAPVNFTIGSGAIAILNQSTSGLVTNSGTLVLNSGMTGNLTNSGTLSVPTTRTIGGSFTQNAGGILSVPVLNNTPGDYGQLQVAGPATLNGIVQLNLVGNGVRIANDEKFDIVTAGGGLNPSSATLSVPPSLVLSFARDTGATVPAGVFRVKAIRKTFENIISDPALKGVVTTFDQIRDSTNPNPVMLALLQKIDAAPTLNDLKEIFLEVLPDANGARASSTVIANHLPLEKVSSRLRELRAGASSGLRTGYSAGDLADGRGSYGPMVFGNTARQKATDGIPGYTSLTGGVGLLGDVPVLDFLKIGAAGSYAGTRVKDTGSSPTTTNITSIQGTLYGSLDYDIFFLDVMGGFASNNYKTTRTIQFAGLQAQSTFTGTQLSGRMNAGLTLPIGNIEMAPMGTLIYSQLTQNKHTETGAPGLNLIVPTQKSTSLQAGLGVQITDVSQAEDFLPEIHVMVLNQVKDPNLAVTSSFTGGGPAFTTQFPSPPKTSINAGVSATGMVAPGLLVSLGYDLESKKNYMSHSASLKIRWIY